MNSDADRVIANEDLETYEFIVRAFKARFPEWYHTHLIKSTDAFWERAHGVMADEKKREYAYDKDWTFESIDEDGWAVFERYDRGDTTKVVMPSVEILGTTEEFVARIEREKREATEKAQVAREAQAAKARREHDAATLRKAAAEQATRDRIFYEEAMKRGIVFS